jgi:hypothetical protein
MPGTAAVRKVIDALRGRLESVPGMASSVYIDRPQEEPFGNAELPALNIRLLNIDFGVFDGGHDLHEVDVDVDIAVDNRNDGINADQADLAAAIVETLWADRTLGGRIMKLVPISLTGDAENGADAGVVPLKYKLIYLTPVGDHFTIVGQSGLTF